MINLSVKSCVFFFQVFLDDLIRKKILNGDFVMLFSAVKYVV